MTLNDENITNQDANDEETIEKVRQQWDMAQSIQNIKLHLYEVYHSEEREVEHTTEEAQSSYEKINTIPIANRVDVNA